MHQSFMIRVYVRINLNLDETSTNKRSTMAGSFSTLCKAKVKFKVPKLNVTAHIFAPFHVTSKKSNYEVILSQDIQRELGMILDVQNNFDD